MPCRQGDQTSESPSNILLTPENLGVILALKGRARERERAMSAEVNKFSYKADSRCEFAELVNASVSMGISNPSESRFLAKLNAQRRRAQLTAKSISKSFAPRRRGVALTVDTPFGKVLSRTDATTESCVQALAESKGDLKIVRDSPKPT